MNREDIIMLISNEMNRGRSIIESFNSYHCIHGYFSDLPIEDLRGIASQYGITIPICDVPEV